MSYAKRIAPNVVAFAEEVQKQAASNPSMKPQYEALGKVLEAQAGPTNYFSIKALDNNLKEDPQFKQQLQHLAVNHPAVLQKALPALMDNSDRMKEMIAKLAKDNPSVVAAPAKPPAPAADQKPNDRPPPITVTTTPQPGPSGQKPQEAGKPPESASKPPGTASAPPAVAAVPAAAANAPAAGTEKPPGPMTAEDKFDALMKMDGAKEFMESIKKNPALASLKDAMEGSGNKDPKAKEQMINQIYAAATSGYADPKDSKFFVNLNKTIAERPGATAALLNGFGDSGFGAKALVAYSGFVNSGIGQFIEKMFGGPGSLDKMVIGLVNSVKQLFGGGNNSPLSILSNNGGGLTQLAATLTGANPSAALVVDPSGNKREMTGQQFQQGQDRSPPPAPPPGQDRENRGPGSTPQ